MTAPLEPPRYEPPPKHLTVRWVDEHLRADEFTADGLSLAVVERDGWCPVLAGLARDEAGRWVRPAAQP